MTGFVQSLSDSMTLIRTDRRIWSAAGFLSVVLSVWLLTSSWRELQPEPEPIKRFKKKEEEEFNLALVDFHKALESKAKKRDELSEVINRTAQELQNDTEKIDWHVNTLMDKLNNMTGRIDKLAHDIGSRKIEKSKLEQRLSQQKKHVKKIVKVDPAEM